MKTRIFLLLTFLSGVLFVEAQDFAYGTVSLSDITMKRYEPDTSAGAVVLKEFGEAYIENGDNYNLVFKFHVRIKILNKNGLTQSDIEIPLLKDGATRQEKILSMKASSFNLENDRVQEQVLADRNVFTENRNKYVDVKKFAIPNVRAGSVIELEYTLESPFIFNFRSWEFQSDIPKIESEYWARMPGVYTYNITLRGFLKLTKNESSIVKDCLGTAQSPISGGFSADCALMKFGMKDIPAFVQEDYMTAKKNFLSSIQFELAQVQHPDGRIDKITKEWKDAELELRQDAKFGVQLRRGRELGQEIEKLIEGENEALVKAKKVYNFIRDWYLWNNTDGKYSEFGIKKAFDARKGNVGDINLSLVAALRFAGLDADPVILSTRDNGTVVELHPVLSEFNYVIAKVTIGEKVYLADATEKHYPFGLLPERCLNGKGRVVGDGQSYWIDLKPTDVGKTVSMLSLVLDSAGVMRGTLVTTFMGYDAVTKREDILSFPTQEDYVRNLKKSLSVLEITGYELKNVDDLEKSITRKLNIQLTAFDDPEITTFLFNPFLLDKWTENPFKSNERLYPVDFGTPMERVMIFTLEYPKEFEIVNIPEKVGLSLPNGGGRFIFEPNNTGNRLSVNHSLSIRKTIFSSLEYHYLKELFNRIIQVQNGELVFKKKT